MMALTICQRNLVSVIHSKCHDSKQVALPALSGFLFHGIECSRQFYTTCLQKEGLWHTFLFSRTERKTKERKLWPLTIERTELLSYNSNGLHITVIHRLLCNDLKIFGCCVRALKKYWNGSLKFSTESTYDNWMFLGHMGVWSWNFWLYCHFIIVHLLTIEIGLNKLEICSTIFWHSKRKGGQTVILKQAFIWIFNIFAMFSCH